MTLPFKPNVGLLIWLTGYSSSGKTTIAQTLVEKLRQEGVTPIHLDGDVLRKSFGSHWGHSVAERHELALVYMRLSKLLVDQGHVVVLSAVAMFPHVYEWLDSQLPNAMLVLVKAPLTTRITRDSQTKRIYSEIMAQAPIYEIPLQADLVLNNDDGADLALLAQAVINLYVSGFESSQDFGRRAHWQNYYTARHSLNPESSFARLTVERLVPGQLVIDVGCGDGRDSYFFARMGFTVIGFDVSEAAIRQCEKRRMPGEKIEFVCGEFDAGKIGHDATPDVIYSRFSLHAMTQVEQDRFLARSFAALPAGGRMFIECRSSRDPLADLGEKLSETERIYGHYRRFIRLGELTAFVRKLGFTVEQAEEVQGVSISGSDDPVLIRAILIK